MTMIEAERLWLDGDTGGAMRSAKAAMVIAPHPRALLVIARVRDEEGAFGEALAHAEAAVRLDAEDMRCAAQLAYARLRTGDIDGARAAADAASALPVADAEALDLIGVVYHRINDYAAGARVLERAAALQPDNARLMTNLASLLTICGDIRGALAAYRRVLTLDPVQPRALAAISEVRRATPDDNNVAQIARAIAIAARPIDRLVLHHALAREQDALDEIAACLATLADGKRGFAGSLPRPLHDDAALFADLAALAQDAHAPDGHRGAAPIFIVGMPRSGTTVVERILSACTGTVSLGESPILPALMRHASGSDSPHIADAAALRAAWHHLPWRDIGHAYVRHAAVQAGSPSRTIDKLPLNFLLADAILAALPDARIVWMVRDPLDTVAGNYRQMFEFETGSYDYSLSLDATAAFLIGERACRARLASRHPDAILSVDHDALVDRPEAEAERIVRFCALPWDPGCVAIERNMTPAGSASAVQVRAPISRDHRDRVRRYRAHLAGVATMLATALHC